MPAEKKRMSPSDSETVTYYIIEEYRRDLEQTHYVCAPPGWFFSVSAGMAVREPRYYQSASPEWTTLSARAYRFHSHRAAARVRNMCGPAAVIRDITN